MGYVCSSFSSTSSGKRINLISFEGHGLDIQRSGYAFLESLHPTQKVYLTREVVGPRPQKQLLPTSKVPQERILVLLDCNSNIFIEGDLIEFKIGSCGSVDNLETDMGIPTGHNEEDSDPHILVQQSYPQELPRRGSADLSYLTPAHFPETIREEPGVQETPSVKSRFMNPDSATVTLPRALTREDTFDKLMPRRNKSLFPSTGADQLPVMNDMDLSMSEDEDEEAVQSSRFFKPAPAESNSVESTADEELPQTSAGGIIVSTASTVLLPRRSDSVKENLEPGAEDMRRQLSGAPMITPFTAGSVGARKVSSLAAEGESSGKPNDGGKDSDMPTKSMKQGIPEGFLYEEHKKDVTPKQTYGKNRRTPRAKPKGETVEMDERIELAIREDELAQGRRSRSAKSENGKIIGGIQETDESEISSSIRVHQEQDDAIMETADEEEGQDIAPPARTLGRRGRMTVQSQPDSTTAEVELGPGRSPRRKKTPSPGLEDSKLNIVEKKAVLASTPNPTRPRRGMIKLPDASRTLLSAAPTTTKPTRSARKRRRTLEDAEADQEPLAEDGDIDSSAESVICVSQEPRSKRAKTTYPKKPAAKTPRGKRGGKGVTPTPPPDNIEKTLGDTQYTFPDVSQTQAMDSVEVKTAIKTPKKAPKTTKTKTTSSTKKIGISPSTRNKKEPTKEGGRLEAKEVEGAGEEKIRTRDKHNGDSPKIVFSNSGLDGKKVRVFHP